MTQEPEYIINGTKVEVGQVGKAKQPQDENGWIEWHGGECPVEEDEDIEVEFRDGTRLIYGTTNKNIWKRHYHFNRVLNDYEHIPRAKDIIAYRIVQTAHSKQEQPSFIKNSWRCVDGEPEQPKKLKLSAWEVVQLVKDSHHYLCSVGECDIGSATYGVANLLAAIEGNQELMERVEL